MGRRPYKVSSLNDAISLPNSLHGETQSILVGQRKKPMTFHICNFYNVPDRMSVLDLGPFSILWTVSDCERG